MRTIHIGWITRYLSRIMMSSLTQTCYLISTTHNAKIKKPTCLNHRSSTTDNYPAQILDVKYKQVNTITVATNQKWQMWTNATTYNMSWLNMENFLMGVLVSIPTQRSTLIYCPAWNWYTIMLIQYLVPMNKQSKRIPMQGWNWNSWRM